MRDAPPLVSFTQISNMVHDVRLYYSPFQCSEQPGWGQPKFENERPARARFVGTVRDDMSLLQSVPGLWSGTLTSGCRKLASI